MRPRRLKSPVSVSLSAFSARRSILRCSWRRLRVARRWFFNVFLIRPHNLSGMAASVLGTKSRHPMRERLRQRLHERHWRQRRVTPRLTEVQIGEKARLERQAAIQLHLAKARLSNPRGNRSLARARPSAQQEHSAPAGIAQPGVDCAEYPAASGKELRPVSNDVGEVTDRRRWRWHSRWHGIGPGHDGSGPRCHRA